MPIFQIALTDIKKFIEVEDEVLDYYSGVGAISLTLASQFKRGILIEENEEAIEFTKRNISQNKITNCEIFQATAGEQATLIAANSVVVLDPPRAGLAKTLVDEILKIQPKRLIYLSCDIATQARDIARLKEKYELRFIKLYNFFPRTPHVECLCVLDKK